jgi:hypothetical protein
MAQLTLPQPPASGALGQYLARLNQTLIRAFMGVATQDDGVPRIILTSPNGTQYAVTVDNSGNLITTAV